jgi:hypothetical protein
LDEAGEHGRNRGVSVGGWKAEKRGQVRLNLRSSSR